MPKSCKYPSSMQGDVVPEIDGSLDLDLRSLPSNHFDKVERKFGREAFDPRQQAMAAGVYLIRGERGEAQDIYLDNHDYR